MDRLQQQVNLAHRRLVVQQFCSRLVWSLVAGMGIALLGIAAPKLVYLPFLATWGPTAWNGAWLGAGLLGGMLAAAAWTVCSHLQPLDAAMEIDRRFGLRERVATSLSLTPEAEQTPAGQAVRRDAQRFIRDLDIGGQFRLRMTRTAWLPLLPAAIAFSLIALVGDRQAESSAEPSDRLAVEKQIEQSAETLREKIAQRRREAEERGLPEAKGILQELEKQTEEIASKKGELDRTKAVVKLNELIQQLRQRKNELGDRESLNRQLQNMKSLAAGPGQKLAAALKQGDWNKALQQAQALEKSLRNGELTPQQQAQLGKQLESMQKSIQSLAEARREAMEQLQKEISRQQEQGNNQQARQLQQQLQQLAAQQKQMEQLQRMAQQMSQAQQALQQGSGRQASQSLAELSKQIAQMDREIEQLEMLDMALDQVQLAKNSVSCQKCQGEGCQDCQGDMFSNFPGSRDRSGRGMGRGSGSGDRPDEENATNLRDTQVKQTPGKGASVFAGLADGPNRKGVVSEQIKEEMASLSGGPADPLAAENLSKSRQEQAQQFFRNLREEP